jgi:SAM-dependent methyltransferase
MPFTCKVCGAAVGCRSYTAREMMFGTRETFEYLECEACQTLQISEVPKDLSRYYPPNYYSFAPDQSRSIFRNARRARDRYGFSGEGLFGSVLSRLRQPPPYVTWLKRLGVNYESKILDVGCGGGVLISSIGDAGFDATGIDAFIDKSRTLPNGVQVLRQSLEDTTGQYDAVMLHHSLEHMSHPAEAIRHTRRILKPGGAALIRIPVAGQLAWRRYGTNWVGLDAPRHLCIPSLAGMLRLAEANRLAAEVVFDSTGQQFWASEMYARGIPLHGSQPSAHFSSAELAHFDSDAHYANDVGDGDQACFYLRVV